MIPLFHIDSFADVPFRGNPAAVCLLERPAPTPWMQQVAAEMNLSETAFVVPRSATEFELRWFTPTVEVALCGHGTLAAAFVLWHAGRGPAGQPIVFHTQSGPLKVRQHDGQIEMDFPAISPTAIESARGLAEALNLTEPPRWLGRAGENLLVELSSAALVRDLTPDFARVAALDTLGVIATARADQPRCDFVSRYFAPAAGINEDPVTGSAHCALAPYWQAQLGKDTLVGYQASPRGGFVSVRPIGSRVMLGGTAVLISEGSLAAA
jgi:PhzF family phenazine biosynthesis protein